jgi:hypothetical protein
MYEYQNGGHFTVPSKNPSNQSGGSISKVTVEEFFDEAGRLVSRKTTTEYSDGKPPAYSINFNTTADRIKAEVEGALKDFGRRNGGRVQN